MIYKIETKQGFIEHEFANLQSAKDFVSAFLSWSGTPYRISKAKQTVANPVNSQDIIDAMGVN